MTNNVYVIDLKYILSVEKEIFPDFFNSSLNYYVFLEFSTSSKLLC